MENSVDQAVFVRKLVQFLLRVGLVLSMILMVTGLFVNVASGHVQSVVVPMFDLLKESLSVGDRLLGMGVLILALTPLIRVITLTLLWMKEKDWKFVGISILVIIALMISVSLGGHA